MVVQLRAAARKVRGRWDRLVGQSPSEISDQAANYWSSTSGEAWRRNSHWREGVGDAIWNELGASSLERAERLVRVVRETLPHRKTVEWGAGGGCQAVVFAPRCDEYVAVDIASESLDECERQVKAACGVPLRKVLVDLRDPRSAVTDIGIGTCDLFLCYYVLELVPSQEHGYEIVDIASDLLMPGGVALFQTKYSTSDPGTRSRRRAYGRDPANMTTYALDEFWEAAVERGLRPEVIELVPQDAVDTRYAYYLLTKGHSSETASRAVDVSS